MLLPDDVLVEKGLHLDRLGQLGLLLLLQHPILGDDVETDIDTLIADEDCRSGDELLDLALALVAERAPQSFIVPYLSWASPPFSLVTGCSLNVPGAEPARELYSSAKSEPVEGNKLGISSDYSGTSRV